jgi:hypothetical protein
MTAIPTSLAQLTPDWVNEQLAADGSALPAVADLSVAPMGGHVGALGEVGVVTVTWDGGDGSEPTRFVAKCPLDDDIARLYNSVMQFYVRECGFYRDLAGDLVAESGMRIPGCHVNRYDPETGAAFLLLDFVDGTPGDILTGCDVDTLRTLVGDLARMHGKFWMDPRLESHDWILDWGTETFKLGIDITRQSWNQLAQTEPDRYPAALFDVLQRTWIDDTEHFLELYAARPWTLGHVDYELDNVIVDADGPIVVDWQSVMRTHPGLDLAWLLAVSHNDETLEAEGELCDHYRSVLAASGGPDWSSEDLEEALAWGILYPVGCQPVPYLQDTSAYGVDADRMHRRFDKFLSGAIEGATRWNLVDHVGAHARR